MKRFVIVTVIAFLATSMAFGLEVILSTGQIKLPNYDGTFSNISISDRAGIFLCLTDVAAYQTYAEDSAGLYQAWQDGDFDSLQYKETGLTGNISSDGYARFYDVAAANVYYAIAIATFYSEEYNRSYYMARTISQEYKGADPDFDTVYFMGTLSTVNSWSPVPEPSSIALMSLGFAVIALRRKVM